MLAPAEIHTDVSQDLKIKYYRGLLKGHRYLTNATMHQCKRLQHILNVGAILRGVSQRYPGVIRGVTL